MFFDPPTHLDNSEAGNSLENQQESDYIPQEKTSAQSHPSFSKKQKRPAANADWGVGGGGKKRVKCSGGAPAFFSFFKK